MMKVVVAAAAAVVSLCTVANAANGTWTYNVAKDAQLNTSSPTTLTGTATNVTRVAQNNGALGGQYWFGDWSAANKTDILNKINTMVPGETYTLTLRLAFEENAAPLSTFTPTVAAFRTDQKNWVEAQVTTNIASGTVGVDAVPWTYNGGTAANGMQNLPITINTNNFDNFGKGYTSIGATATPVWASVVLDPTVTNLLLTGTDIGGLRGYSIPSQAFINDRVYTKEKWGGAAAPNLVLTIVPEPATLGIVSLCSLALLRRKRS